MKQTLARATLLFAALIFAFMIPSASAQTPGLNNESAIQGRTNRVGVNVGAVNSIAAKPKADTTGTSTAVINYPSGFASSNGQIWLENQASLAGSMIHLVPSTVHNASNAWYEIPESVQMFSTTFTFHVVCPAAPTQCGDGFGFMIISNPNNTDAGFTYSGYSGGQFSWSQCQAVPSLVCPYPGQPNIHSVMVKFDLYNETTSDDTANLTGFYTDGEFPQPPNPEFDMKPSGINMQSGDEFSCTFTYDGTTLKQSLTDTVTGATYTNSYVTNIPATVLGNSAFIGFGGGTGAAVDDVYLDSWTYATGTSPITSPAAAPTFSVAAGTYTSAQTVTLANSTNGSNIYYTTDGTVPTTSSAKYAAPITVGATETIGAIAVASGYTNSPVATASYIINVPTAGSTLINYPNGGFAASAFDLNGGATVTPAGLVQLTDGGGGEGRSAWFATQVPVQTFTTDFTFQQLNAGADGMTFTIQGQGPAALGATGGSLGYAGIGNSVAVKFDVYNNSGEGNDSTGLYVNGAQPSVPAINLSSSGIVLTSGHLMHAHLVYDGITLTMTLTDTTNGTTVTQAFPVNIPNLVGGDSAYVGFTGGTGGQKATQNVLSWTYSDVPEVVLSAPNYTVAPGTYTTPQTVGISNAANGAAIYYTTDGTTPTTNSAVYTSAISISTTKTLKAIAAMTGYSNSVPASATYVIMPVLPTPTFSLAAGTYTSAQSVSIQEATAGSTIYYTTNGTAPTTSSTKYTGAITVSATETLKAIAVAPNDTNSAVASATYAIDPVLPTPTFSLAAGTYSSAQSVTIKDATATSTIYYTTDGTTPTTSSAKYTGAITVSATETLKAIAVAVNDTNSAVASVTYTINVPPASAPKQAINYPTGFASSTGQIWLENQATLSGSMIHLVPSTVHNASNAWYETPENVQAFTTTFTFHVKCPAAPTQCGDGFGFMIISNPNNTDAGFTYSGYSGGQFSWSQCQSVPSLVCPYAGQPNIHSIMVKFDLYNVTTSNDTANLTGFYTDGEFPQPPNPEYDMAPSGINIQSGHEFTCTFTYDGTTLKQSLTDTVTGATYTNSYVTNIPSTVLGNSAFIGFGGGTGAAVDDVYLDSWTYTVE